MAVATATHSGFVCLSGQAHIRFHNGFAHPSLERCFIPHFRQDLRIEQAALGENVSIFGAAALVVTKGGLTDVNEVIAHLKTV